MAMACHSCYGLAFASFKLSKFFDNKIYICIGMGFTILATFGELSLMRISLATFAVARLFKIFSGCCVLWYFGVITHYTWKELVLLVAMSSICISIVIDSGVEDHSLSMIGIMDLKTLIFMASCVVFAMVGFSFTLFQPKPKVVIALSFYNLGFPCGEIFMLGAISVLEKIVIENINSGAVAHWTWPITFLFLFSMTIGLLGITLCNIWMYRNLHSSSIIPFKAISTMVLNILSSVIILDESIHHPWFFWFGVCTIFILLSLYFYITPPENATYEDYLKSLSNETIPAITTTPSLVIMNVLDTKVAEKQFLKSTPRAGGEKNVIEIKYETEEEQSEILSY